MVEKSLAERLWLGVEEPEYTPLNETLLWEDEQSRTHVDLLPGRPRIPNLVLPEKDSRAPLREREDDRDGSVFYTKAARLPDVEQVRPQNDEVVRSITNASLTMTILKDKDEDWDDFQGQGQCTIGFIYSLTLRWRTIEFPGFSGGLLQAGNAPLKIEPFTKDGMTRGNQYSVTYTFAVSPIDYIQAQGAYLQAKRTIVRVVR